MSTHSTKSTKSLVFRTMRSRDHDVVVVRRTINLGYWEFGMGREWGGVEKGRSVYEQPGTKVDRILSCQGGFPSK
jgi:hypothetical protein